jgi:Fic family protein
MTVSPRQQRLLACIDRSPQCSISTIAQQLGQPVSIPTLNRDLAHLVALGLIEKHGKARTTHYSLSTAYRLCQPVDLEAYFDQEPDARQGYTRFNEEVFATLQGVSCFTVQELDELAQLQERYQRNIAAYPPTLFAKEMERLTIELSWKSSQIEGNTYSLLDTERLFLEHEKAPNKPEADATMLLNHKKALGYLLAHPDLGSDVTVRLIEELHALLIEGLGVGRNLRSRSVGVTGTAYKPLDTVYQIREALEQSCEVINQKASIFEKALLAVLLISYLQPFEDGNKRTGRMLGNAILIHGGMCPLSYRSVDSLVYKKAMLLFYEQTNLSAFKTLFLEQVRFSATTYFQ